MKDQDPASLKRRIRELERAEAEWKKERDELKKSEALSLSYFDLPLHGIAITSPEKGWIRVNDRICSILGYSREEIVRMTWAEMTHPDDLAADLGQFHRVLSGQIDHYHLEKRFIRKEGTIVWTNLSVGCLRKPDGRVDYFIALVEDITSFKSAEEALTQSEEKFRKAFYTSPDSVNINRLEDGLYVSINPGFTKLTGYLEEDILGKTSLEINIWGRPEDRQKLVAGLKKDGVVINLEAAFRTKRGETRIGLMSATMIDLHGVPHILSITRDISDRKRAEQALRESENKYRLLAENVNDVIFVLDMNLNYTYVSPSVKILRGYDPAEVLKQRSSETLTPSSWDLAMRTLSEVLELEKSGGQDAPVSRILPLEMVRRDGTPVWTEVKFSIIRDDQQRPTAILGVTRDITERRRVEEKLQKTLQSLRTSVGTTIQVMVSAVEIRDPYTAGHQLRSADLARAIAAEMGLPHEKIDGIRMAGSIHDIGKLSVPAEILSKPSKLTEMEFSLIKEHSQKGYEMLKDVESPFPLAEIVYQHHERIDGSGYPRKLKGEEILLEARILAVSDVVESMASHRPYRPALGVEAALAEIEKNRGILYDEAVAEACLRLFREKGYKLP